MHTAAFVCNFYQHSSTCHWENAGEKCCRLSHPQAIVEKTGCCQLKPKLPCPENPPKNISLLHYLQVFANTTFKCVIGYELFADVELPLPDSRRSRNIYRMPIPLHDGRLIMLEIERKHN